VADHTEGTTTTRHPGKWRWGGGKLISLFSEPPLVSKLKLWLATWNGELTTCHPRVLAFPSHGGRMKICGKHTYSMGLDTCLRLHGQRVGGGSRSWEEGCERDGLVISKSTAVPSLSVFKK